MNTHNCMKRNRRRGAVLLAVLVCLGIASAITGVAVHRSLSARRQLNHNWQLEQTRMLLDAGIRRMHRKLAEKPDYTGESWRLDGALESYATARVEIEVTNDEATNGNTPVGNSDEPVAMLRRFQLTATIQNRDVHPFQTKRSRIIAVHATQQVGAADPTDDAGNNASD